MGSWTIERVHRLDLDEPVERLDVSLISARLNVVATDGPARVEVTRINRKPLLVKHSDGVLRLRHAGQPRWPGLAWWFGQQGRQYHTEVSVAVPHGTASELRVVSGSLVVTGLRADAVLDVTSGGITMLGLDGRIAATVVSGTIEALGVAGDLTMETTSGEITLADSAASRVSAKAVSGSLTVDLDNPHGSDIRLETMSGAITVRVRADSDLDVHLQATSGRVSSGFRELSTDGHAGSRCAHGRLGAGTGRLYATAMSGNIALLPRPVDIEEPA